MLTNIKNNSISSNGILGAICSVRPPLLLGRLFSIKFKKQGIAKYKAEFDTPLSVVLNNQEAGRNLTALLNTELKKHDPKHIKNVVVTDTSALFHIDDDGSWKDLRPKMEKALYSRIDPGKAHSMKELKMMLDEIFIEKTEDGSDQEMEQMKKACDLIVESAVNPTLAKDKGSAQLAELEAISIDDIPILERRFLDKKSKTRKYLYTIKLLLKGACKGCPSSVMTMKNFVETTIKELLPGKVWMVNEYH